ncbi:hypothetical protein LDENG_00111190 [Lucifuga dentata]|nr:hypothetical protein LDENG_00111190 [Lucifuga dentata]
MKACACKRKSVCAIIFLSLIVLVLLFMLWNLNNKLIFQKNIWSTEIIRVASTESHHQFGFCSDKHVSPEDAQEEHHLLDSIAWPETPHLPTPFSIEQTSDPAHSTFAILPARGDGQLYIGDQLEALIQVHDFQGNPKKSGGDVLIARLHNRALGAGVAGQVVDHLNGSYSALFPLLWEGSAQVEVTLVHPSEAVTVLRRLTNEQPDRIFFHSRYRSGSVSDITVCNVCLPPTKKPVCNYTDLTTGEPWFCYKPKSLSCDTRVSHGMGGFKQNITAQEEKLFHSGVNMKVSIRASGYESVTVLPKEKGQPQCLKGKMVHLYGDSTIRQWFEHLQGTLPALKQFDLPKDKQVGPFMAIDIPNKIMVTYRCHGPPIRFGNVPTSELRYIANEIDGLVGGANTVVVISIWSHFSTFPVEIYIRRLQSIRRALVRLLNRAPDTLVVIRTANLKALTLYETLTNSD